MRIASYQDRLTALVDGGGIDVAEATRGRFTPDVLEAIERWDELGDVLATVRGPVHPVDPTRLDAPVRLPRQVFAIGLNYREHAAESGITDLPTSPPVFTNSRSASPGRRRSSPSPAPGSTTRPSWWW